MHIIEAKGLKGKDWGGISDPVGVVSCLRQKKHTKIFKKTTSAVFDEILVLELHDVLPEQIESERLTVRHL